MRVVAYAALTPPNALHDDDDAIDNITQLVSAVEQLVPERRLFPFPHGDG
jgi:hypothetical protein